MRWLGLLALGSYAAVAVFHARRGHPEEMLWACHVAALAVGLGLLAGSPALVAVGVTWLLVGVPLWIMDLAFGGEFIPPSVLTHAGGLILGLMGLSYLGVPPQIWWKALVALLLLQQLCRWITPTETNVNVAFAVYGGAERWFPSYRLYLLFLVAAMGILFFAAEHGLRRLVGS